jgi:hypothetical protein
VHSGGIAEQPERHPVPSGAARGAAVRGRTAVRDTVGGREGRGSRDGLGQAVDEGGAAAGVLQAHPADVTVQVARAEQGQDRVLDRLGYPRPDPRPQRGQLVDQPGRGDQPARAEGGGQHLGRGAEVDDDAGVHAVQRGQRADVVAELAVVVVFHDDRAGLPGPRDQRLPAAHRQAAAERVLVGGGGVEQPQVTGQFLGDEAVPVDPAGHHPGAGPAQDLAPGGVTGLLQPGPVPRRQQRVREQREPAGHPLGDQDAGRRHGQPAGAAQVGGDLQAQLGQPVGVGPAGRQTRPRLPPRPPPGGGLDSAGPGDPGLQVDRRGRSR